MTTCRPGWVVACLASMAGFATAQSTTAPPVPNGDLPSYRAPSDPKISERPVEAFRAPSGTISLRDALAAALVNNPELAAFSWEVRAREARALQAGLLPNPEVATEFEDFGGSGQRRGWHSAQTTVSLAQLVELGGKRAKRYRVASVEADLAGWDYETRRLTVLAAATKAFVAVLATQERLALADDLVRLASQSVQTVAGTVKTGAVSPLEQARAEVARSRAEIDRAQLRHELEEARAALAVTWGARAATFDRVRGELKVLVRPPGLDTLVARATDNPDLARWAAELAQREATLSLEQARRIPDVTVRVGGRQYADNGDGAVVAEFSFPLPLFNRNQGNILDAQYGVAKARAERDAAEAGVHADLARAFEAFAAAYEQAITLRDVAIPKARTVYDGVADAYAKGLFRYIEVLDAQRTLFELRGQYLQATAAYHSAAADLERLTGAPLPHPTAESDR